MLPLLLVISNLTYAEVQQESAKMFAAKLVLDTNSKVAPVDASSMVDQAFKQGSKHKIDPLFILAIIRKESTFNKKARSGHNAAGLMQVMPRWHKDKIKGRNIYSVSVNVEVGTQILSDCLIKNNGNLNRAMRCYSGGHNPRYYADVRKYHKSMKQLVIENQFKSQLPVYYVQYNEDKLNS